MRAAGTDALHWDRLWTADQARFISHSAADGPAVRPYLFRQFLGEGIQTSDSEVYPILDLAFRQDAPSGRGPFMNGRTGHKPNQEAGNRVSQVSGSERVGMMAPKINVSPVQP